MNKSIVENLYGHNLKRSDRWTFIMKVIFLKWSKIIQKTLKFKMNPGKGNRIRQQQRHKKWKKYNQMNLTDFYFKTR